MESRTGEERSRDESPPLVTGLMAELAQVESARAHLNDLVRQAPVAILITRGPDHLIELANAGAEELLGRSGLEGRTVRDALPEVVSQGFVALMDRVYAGEAYVGRELEVALDRVPGQDSQTGWYDLLYQPLRDAEGRVDGVFALGIEVTAQVRARRKVEAHAAAAAEAEREMRASHAMLDSLLDTAPVGIGFWDRQLRYVRVNETLAQINGMPAKDHVGRSIGEVLGHFGAGLEELFARILATSEPVLDVDVTGETPAAPGVRRSWMASYYPVPGPHPGDPPIGVGAVLIEVTERVRRRERERLLADAGLALESSLGFDDRVRRVSRLVVPRIADWCVVSRLEADGRLVPLSVEHADPERRDAALRYMARWPTEPDDGGPYDVIATGRSAFVPELPDSAFVAAARDEEHLRELRALTMRSYICVPLRARGRALGTMSLVRTSANGPLFGPEDLTMAEELGRRVGLALDNARLYESQRDIAATLQASLLPPRMPVVPGLEVATRYRAGGEGVEVGGDFYDLVPCGRGWMLVLGDVCGKGAEAAAMTALCRYTVRAAARHQSRPARVLGELNDEILREHDDQRFCTAVCARILPPSEHAGAGVAMVLARGGHPRPYVVRAGGRVEGVGGGGSLIGVRPDPDIAEERLHLDPGDALVLYTDGLSEARGADGRLFGTARLERVLAECAGLGAEAMASHVEAAVTAHQGAAARDDLALVVARARTADAGPGPAAA